MRSIEHASLIDDEALAMAKASGTWLVMDIYNGDYIDDVGTKEKWPEEYLRKNRETTDVQREGFAKAVKMGVKLAYGTDSGVYPHGGNAKQFAYMVRYGMTPMQAIQSATIRAAELLGKEGELGSIAPGRFADLVAVEGDPLTDVRSAGKCRSCDEGRRGHCADGIAVTDIDSRSWVGDASSASNPTWRDRLFRSRSQQPWATPKKAIAALIFMAVVAASCGYFLHRLPSAFPNHYVITLPSPFRIIVATFYLILLATLCLLLRAKYTGLIAQFHSH